LVQRVVFPGEGFFFDSASSKRFLPFIGWITVLFIGGSLLLLVVNLLRERRAASDFLRNNRRVIFSLLTLALGPGLLVNSLLKSHWGRARPIEVSAFGGARSFSPAYIIAQQCSRNCSFVSGDAAMGYYLIAFLFIARKRARDCISGRAGRFGDRADPDRSRRALFERCDFCRLCYRYGRLVAQFLNAAAQ